MKSPRFLPTLVALRANTTCRHQHDGDRADEDGASRQIQDPVSPRVRRQHVRREDGRHDTEETAPEAGQSGCRTADRRREDLRGPPVQYRVEHALEEVLHHIEADVRRFRVDGREEEERCRHESR